MLWAIEFNMIIFIKSNYFCVSANLKQLSFLYVFKRLNNNPTLKIASLKVSKSRKQFLELSILPKNERKTWKKYPKRSQNNIFSCFVCFFENVFQIYWLLEQFLWTVKTMYSLLLKALEKLKCQLKQTIGM